MSDHFEAGDMPCDSVAWIVSCHGYADMVTWAPTIGAARWNWVKFFRDCYGNDGTFPRLSAGRYPRLDRSHLPRGFRRRVMTREEAVYA